MTVAAVRHALPPVVLTAGVISLGWVAGLLCPAAPYGEIALRLGPVAGLAVWLGFPRERRWVAAALWGAVWLVFVLAGTIAPFAILPLLLVLIAYTGARAAGRGRRVAVFLFTLVAALLAVEAGLDLYDPAGAVPELLASEKLRTWQLRTHTDLFHNLEKEGQIELRGKPWSLVKPPGVKRIVCLGSSSTWGPGLTEEETYPARLAALLGPEYQVGNAGCSGYNSFQLGIFLEQVLLPAAPDLVIFYYGGNEMYGSDSVAYWRYANDLLAPVKDDDPDFREKALLYGTTRRISILLLDFFHGLRSFQGLWRLVVTARKAMPFVAAEGDVLDSAAVLDRMVRATTARGVPLLLVPEVESGVGVCSPEYAGLMQRAAVHPLVTFLDVAAELQAPENFLDPVHLSPAGAARLAALLINRGQSPISQPNK